MNINNKTTKEIFRLCNIDTSILLLSHLEIYFNQNNNIFYTKNIRISKLKKTQDFEYLYPINLNTLPFIHYSSSELHISLLKYLESNHF